MTKLSQTGGHSRSHSSRSGDLMMRTRWTGWVFFAAMMLILLGFLQAMEGLIALFNSDFYVVGPEGFVIDVDFTVWGWVLLILGAAAVATGFGLMAGNIVARVVGIAFAMLSAIANLLFLPAFPLWGALALTVNVIVIYAIAVHGREVKN
ncbi:MAG: hypothetical protein WBA97_19145 [Actinophytocola sp.]|uniref:DUF7144 family membrane protein n=1 Tax=Actinophytocola sp. TaxID=1872138 RepID=UPI003C73AFF6